MNISVQNLYLRYILGTRLMLDQTCSIQNLLITFSLGPWTYLFKTYLFSTKLTLYISCKNLPFSLIPCTHYTVWTWTQINKSHFVTRILPHIFTYLPFWIRILFLNHIFIGYISFLQLSILSIGSSYLIWYYEKSYT